MVGVKQLKFLVKRLVAFSRRLKHGYRQRQEDDDPKQVIKKWFKKPLCFTMNPVNPVN